MIISRYLLSEIIKTTCAVILILVFIGISNEFVVYLAKAASGKLPASVVLKVVFYSLPHLVGILLPIGFFLGILLAYGRLYADSEMTVLTACGFTLSQQLKLAFYPALFFTLLMFYFNIWLIPAATKAMETVVSEAESDIVTRAFSPGRFQQSDDGRYIFFADDVSADKAEVFDVFFAQKPPKETLLSANPNSAKWTVVTGNKGYRWVDPSTQEEYLILTDGYQYTGVPGQKEFAISQFNEYGIHLKPPQHAIASHVRTKSLQALSASATLEDMAELQWRISMPLALLVVGLLAVPLSKVSPRRGKYASLLPSIVVVIVYCNLLIIGRSWIQQGIVPSFIGLWWVHLLGVILALLMIAYRLNFWSRFKRPSKTPRVEVTA